MKENNEIKETLEGSIDRIDRKRRSFAKTGVAVPVIMTLASKPVFGAECLSEMMSGNLSGHTHTHGCFGGNSPGFWKTPNGAPDYTSETGDRWFDAWTATGYKYASDTSMANRNNNWKWDDFDGGTPLSSVTNGVYYLNADDDRSLRQVLNEEPGTDIFHLIAGLLNARYYATLGPSVPPYMFSVDDFWAMFAGVKPIPPAYNSLREMIEFNYHIDPPNVYVPGP